MGATLLGCSFFLGRWSLSSQGTLFPSPFTQSPEPTEKPLAKYTLTALADYPYQTSPITIEKILSVNDDYSSYLFSYTTVGKKMTGQLNVPANTAISNPAKVIIMLRGYVPLNIYTTGVGTKNAAAVYAQAGFITIAPDFFGYGDSDPEPTDTWQARFEKPIVVIELLKSLQTQPLVIPADTTLDSTALGGTPKRPLSTTGQTITPTSFGFWGHSNGGQIALSVLEVLNQPFPTTLWAPVTVPFPYSILFFSDESDDEGKATRKWISIFEQDYDVFDFSLTQHISRLTGPLQLHHGTADEAALTVWSDEFVDKIKAENLKRTAAQQELEDSLPATTGATATAAAVLDPIDLTYFTYPGADHNLQPGWDTVVERDLVFFKKFL